jgi:hypothetical protein
LRAARAAAGAAAALATVLSSSGCGAKGAAATAAPDPERLTLADGSRVYVSPRRNESDGWFPPAPSALWARPEGGEDPRRLTFGPASVADPTVLDDGRVLFVSAMPRAAPGVPVRLALFVVNSDGTGVLPYACQHDGAPIVRRPREVGDDRVAFAAADSPGTPGRWEFVLSARPFRSRAPLPPELVPEVETVTTRPRRPMGRLSTVDPAKKSGVLLCLDARRNGENEAPLPVARVRILTGAPGPDGTLSLGEVPVAADGSFLVEVPADVPLGVESLDAGGRVLRTLPPWFWVRPGESRGCIGCHEPHGMAPRNERPLATKAGPARLTAGGTS